MKQYEATNLQVLTAKNDSIKKMRVNPIHDGEEWKINIMEELVLMKKGFLEVDIDIEEDDIDIMLESIATD